MPYARGLRPACLAGVLLVVVGAGAQDVPPAGSAAESSRPVLAGPFGSPRQLLRLFDIGDSDWRSFRDGEPIVADDQEALTKLLYRVPQINADEIARWQHAEVSWSALRTEPESVRGEFFLVSGRVRAVERRSLTPRLATLFDFERYYQLEVELDAGQGTAVIFTRSVPQAWRDQSQLNERTRTPAMFVKVGGLRGALPSLVFVAPRIAWLPDRPDASLGVTADQVLLSQLGMDCGLWDDVRTRHRLPIGADERECFYALLSAVGRAEPAALAQRAEPAALAQLLQHPEQSQGSILRVTGRVRRVTRVIVDEPDIQQRYGIAAYYQLDLMVHVGDQPIEVRGENGAQAGPVYRESFPATCCALQVPASWESLVGAAKVNQPVLVDGVFYKLWAYSNALVAAHDVRQQQLCPMFVVTTPQTWDLSFRSSRGPGLWIALGCCGLLAGVWAAVWTLYRSKQRRARRKSLPPLDFD